MKRPSTWRKQLSLSHKSSEIRILIVCRGPIRMEALEIFKGLGLRCGILLSEKDSMSYTHTKAPELRTIEDKFVHRVPDYIGVGQVERQERIQEIIQIAKSNAYNYIFAGYGFMAEDGDFVNAIEEAGLNFIGPASPVHRQAGAKDMAKNIARQLDVSVIPGLDNISALALSRKYNSDKKSLLALAQEHKFEIKEKDNIEILSEEILQASYAQAIPLLKIADLQKEAKKEGAQILKKNSGYRLRLKYIGGGGGKGQRVVSQADEIPNAVMEILSEAKATGDADNKNFLLELNIENIRHNEIQLIGNGEWCVSLGGRDCSLQIHEQKLVELAISDELFSQEIKLAQEKGSKKLQSILEFDRKLLADMEEQAVRFAKAVSLNSASTFECIVTQDNFFFMEMNTRIQVEHRVTEMIYSLRFHNADDPNDFFDVESLLEAMLLVAVFGKALPCPKRIQRYPSGAEIRLNAQNDGLQPAAGSLIEYWSPPLETELRDDQGISLAHPDTGEFIPYHLAGAYDSNIALLVTHGQSRRDNLEELLEILRRTEINGRDVQTNLHFHQGIINFCLGLNPLLKPNTNFVQPYLCAIGLLACELENIDLNFAWQSLEKTFFEKFGQEGVEILNLKKTLLLHPLDILQKQAHLCAAWLVRNWDRAFSFQDNKVVWRRNPLYVLADLYHTLHIEDRKEALPSQKIWDHDQKHLEEGLSFYKFLDEEYLKEDSDLSFQESLKNSTKNESVFSDTIKKLEKEKDSEKIITAHCTWQLGLSLLEFFIYAGQSSYLFDIQLDEQYQPVFPKELLFKEENQKVAMRALVPPPKRTADIIVAEVSGMFYARETPEAKLYVEKGSHFKKGDTLYIIEVMKMFNKFSAEFSGTITDVLMEGQQGKVVKKGDPLFRVKPDEIVHIETEEEKKKRRREYTLALFKSVSKVSSASSFI